MYIATNRYPFGEMRVETGTGGVAGNSAYYNLLQIWDFFHNVKGLNMKIEMATLEEGAQGLYAYTRRAYNPILNPFSSGVAGVKDACSAYHFKYDANSTQTGFSIDFTRTKYQYHQSLSAGTTLGGPKFWPYINILGISRGGLEFSNGSYTPIANGKTTVEIPVYGLVDGPIVNNRPGPLVNIRYPSDIDTTWVSVQYARITVSERYDQITVTPSTAKVSQQITIHCPPFTQHNGTVPAGVASREGFKYIYKIRFTGGAEIMRDDMILTNTNPAAGAPLDTIKVIVPASAKTGPIEFFSRPLNPTGTDRTENEMRQDDYFTSRFNLVIDN